MINEEDVMLDVSDDITVQAEQMPIEAAEPEPIQTEESVHEPAAEEALESEVPAEPVEMTEIISVQFRRTGKVYYFDPCGYECETGDPVIVDTSRGIEYGICRAGNHNVESSRVIPPLRRTIRKATDADSEHRKQNEAREKEAFEVCLDRIKAHRLEMKLIDVEYTFDNSKLLFYFTADGRVDFRELVKDLAAVFRTRIEMRQVGIRDEAKLLGGLGVCGRPFCCATFLADFGQVSIHMAKEQNLSLNSSKISGSCGRLMCCLRYEYDTYADLLKNMPPLESRVITPDGGGIVTEISALAGLIKVKLDPQEEDSYKVYSAENVSADPNHVFTPPAEPADSEVISSDPPYERRSYERSRYDDISGTPAVQSDEPAETSDAPTPRYRDREIKPYRKKQYTDRYSQGTAQDTTAESSDSEQKQTYRSRPYQKRQYNDRPPYDKSTGKSSQYRPRRPYNGNRRYDKGSGGIVPQNDGDNSN